MDSCELCGYALPKGHVEAHMHDSERRYRHHGCEEEWVRRRESRTCTMCGEGRTPSPNVPICDACLESGGAGGHRGYPPGGNAA